MNDQTMTMPSMKVAVASKENANYVAGRRAFFKYRDLGVTEGTNGFMRAQVTSAEQGMSKPTGWHVHKCQAQLVYVLSGWVDLVFADRKVRVNAGELDHDSRQHAAQRDRHIGHVRAAGGVGSRRNGHRALRAPAGALTSVQAPSVTLGAWQPRSSPRGSTCSTSRCRARQRDRSALTAIVGGCASVS